MGGVPGAHDLTSDATRPAPGTARLARVVHHSTSMANAIVRRRRDGIIQILPPRSRRGDPHLTSLLALLLGTALYISTAIQWTGAMLVVGLGCLARELLHACRACTLRRRPSASIQDFPSPWRRAS